MKTRFRAPVVLALSALALIALAAAAAPASAAFGDRILRKGMEGNDVRVLQRKLTRVGFSTEADGRFRHRTKVNLQAWERRAGRRENGVCSRADARVLKEEAAATREQSTGGDGQDAEPLPAAESTTPAYGSRRMMSGDRGGDVKLLQRYLDQVGLTVPIDGVYGSQTRVAVERWEAWRYRRANGRVSKEEAGRIRNDALKGRQYRNRRYVFPVRGTHSYGGSGSRFGAPRSGHTHQGQDVAAAQGTPLVAVHTGRVAYRQYQAGGAGHYLVIHGRTGEDSVYMHMPRSSPLEPGEHVRAGEVIGRVGCTGSCSGPHLHFELWTPNWYAGGQAYDPLPDLQLWDERT